MLDIWDAFMNLKVENKFTFIGLTVTAIISLLTLLSTKRISKKTAYISSVTKERIDSMSELKEQISQYLSLVLNYNFSSLEEEKEQLEFVRAIDYRKSRISFQLNESNTFEIEILNTLSLINKIIKVLIMTNKETVSFNPLNLLKEYNLTVSELVIENQVDLEMINQEQFTSILMKSLKKSSENLVSSFNKHLKNEWEKVKKEAK